MQEQLIDDMHRFLVNEEKRLNFSLTIDLSDDCLNIILRNYGDYLMKQFQFFNLSRFEIERVFYILGSCM